MRYLVLAVNGCVDGPHLSSFVLSATNLYLIGRLGAA
jgi:hypothetical protein